MSAAEYFLACIRTQIERDRARYSEHGWKFNVRGPDTFMIGDLVGAIMAVDNADDARRFYAGYLEELQRRDDLTRPAEEIVRANIGWCFGEGMPSERIAMWVESTGSAHPIFGTMATPPTPEEALEAGRRLGEKS